MRLAKRLSFGVRGGGGSWLRSPSIEGRPFIEGRGLWLARGSEEGKKEGFPWAGGGEGSVACRPGPFRPLRGSPFERLFPLAFLQALAPRSLPPFPPLGLPRTASKWHSATQREKPRPNRESKPKGRFFSCFPPLGLLFYSPLYGVRGGSVTAKRG